MATHSSILPGEFPCTAELGVLPSGPPGKSLHHFLKHGPHTFILEEVLIAGFATRTVSAQLWTICLLMKR